MGAEGHRDLSAGELSFDGDRAVGDLVAGVLRGQGLDQYDPAFFIRDGVVADTLGLSFNL
ncbi:MAG: hypothetical protein ACRDPW_03000 [Mycobacteriales bacterium]